MTKTEYLTENRAYLRDQADLIESLTEAQFQALLAITEEMGNADPGIDNNLVRSHESLADYDDSRMNYWRERGGREEVSAASFDAVIYTDFQMIKGQPRRSAMAVVQFDGFTVSVA